MKVKNYIIIYVCLLVFLLTGVTSYASELKIEAEPEDYSQEYKDYINLTEEEQQKYDSIPHKYDIISNEKENTNPVRQMSLLRASSETSFDLRKIIPNNVVVRNQMTTNMCWSFASIAALESNLALKNYYNNNTEKIYDFSERHMAYSSVRNFKNGAINKYGVNLNVAQGGNINMAINYLTNGNGAINEEDMPFSDNQETIDISEIQNKNVETEILDIKMFDSINSTSQLNRDEIMQELKQYIKTHGAVFAQIYGAQIQSDYYNNATGAVYCESSQTCPPDHAVAIIGWDDTYPISNFMGDHQPSKPGAWIVKNSWGEKQEYTLNELKEEIWKVYSQVLIEKGINSAQDIPDEDIIEICEDMGYTYSDNKLSINIGNKGCMYVSYEDANILTGLFGIENALDSKTYDNVYIYDELGWNYSAKFNGNKIFVASKFNKETSKNEYITKIGIYLLQETDCKFYVNQNGNDLSKNSLKEVDLKNGNGTTITLGAGFHSVELAAPVKINTEEFAVAVELVSNSGHNSIIMECVLPEKGYDNVHVENGKCFFTTQEGMQQNQWIDLSQLSQVNNSLLNGDSSIRVYTKENVNTDEQIENENTNTSTATNTTTTNTNTSTTTNTTTTDTNTSTTTNTTTTDTNTSTTTNTTTTNTNNNTYNEITSTTENENSNTIIRQELPYTSGEETTQNSDFSKIDCSVSDITKNKMHIKIEGIGENKNVDSVNYYYYLSNSNNDRDTIEEFELIENYTLQNGVLEFDIYLDDIANVTELDMASDVYLYVREEVLIGGNLSTYITNPIRLDTKQTTTTEDETQQNKKYDSGIKDDTTSPTIIPYTGTSSVMLIATIIFIAGGIALICFVKLHRKMNGK